MIRIPAPGSATTLVPLGLSGSSRLSGAAKVQANVKLSPSSGNVPVRRVAVTAFALYGQSSASAAEVPLPETTAAVAATDGAAHQANAANYVQTASLSRVIVSVGSGASGRPVGSMLSGPMSVLLGFFVSMLSVFVAARAYFVSRAKNCNDCKGYGIQRCRLCEGQGRISWEGKWLHEYDCPLCFSKRYTRCSSCGGMHAKNLFVHTKEIMPREPFTPTRKPLINPGEPAVPVSQTVMNVRTVVD